MVTGDHGESLGEHTESGHAFFVYGVTTHVPLILSGPYSGLAGRRIPQVVRVIDILPTILELLGVGRPAPGLGISLIPLLRAGAAARPPAYSESYYPRFHFGWSDLRTLRTDRYRFIEAPRPELYELGTDPEEVVNLASASPLVVERMREMLAEAEREMGESTAPPQPAEMDDETQKKLASLGYIGSTVDTSGVRSADLPDPKDKIDIVNRMHAAREDQLRGDSDAAIEKLSRVVVDAPEVIDAYFRLGNAYASSGQLDEALAMYRKTLSLKPDHDWAVVGMADAYVDMGRIEEAILGYRTFLRRDPDNENVTYRLAETLLDAGRLDEAGATFRRVLEIWPRRASAAVGLAAVALKRSDPDAARAQIQRALAIDPSARNAHYNLALALEAQGDPSGAMAAYRREISLREQASSASQASKARFNLARLLGQAGDRQGQVRELQASLRDNPDFLLGRYFLAKALLDAADLAGAEEQARRALAMAPDHYYAPLGHYVLADIYNRQGRPAEAREEARQGRILESRDLPKPPS